MEETFKPHPLYQGYTVGDKGTVNGIRKNNIGYTKPDGYRYAWIKDVGWRYVHRLVWETFVGAIPDNKEINHKDGVKANCALTNLELMTHKENIQHSYDVLKRNKPKGKDHWNYGRKPSAETRAKMAAAKRGTKHPKFKGWWCVDGVNYNSLAEASQATNLAPHTIRYRCLHNARGYSFVDAPF